MKSMLILFISYCLLCQGYALFCYNCTSNSLNPDPQCMGKHLSNNYLSECPPHMKYCRVQRTTATILTYRSTLTIRECSATPVYREDCVYTRRMDTITCFSTCKTDACNKGNNAKTIFPCILLMLTCLIASVISRW
uniref:uncharacterized protein LOC120347439 n=1 Tax=Styela clava TaxID=7725 RepID=UPI001939BC7F|nr:uncharacterized protein LOC120347439 [Styela clava]XP_039273362.1 uncharacterized protein LOC120347439 [Styela clava]